MFYCIKRFIFALFTFANYFLCKKYCINKRSAFYRKMSRADMSGKLRYKESAQIPEGRFVKFNTCENKALNNIVKFTCSLINKLVHYYKLCD